MSKLSNVATRVIVSVIAIPLILGLCYLGGYYFLILVLGISLTAYSEYTGLSKKKDTSPLVFSGFAGISAIILNAFFHFIDFQTLFIIILILVVFYEMFRNKGSAILNTSTTLLGLMYTGMFLSSLIEIRELYQGTDYIRGAYLIFSILAGIWICDSAAYFGGLSFGKHRLFERVSPKKSWEGAVFGFVFCVAALAGAKYLILDFLELHQAVIIGIITGTVGQMGDLAESLFKRDAGVKDSSGLIPGHGGIFDRFDSLIAAGPVVYVYLKLFVIH